MTMITYVDGTEVRVGDAVRLARGVHTGTVLHVIESAHDVHAWNVGVPGVMIDTSFDGWCFYRKDSLTDEDEIVFVSRTAA